MEVTGHDAIGLSSAVRVDEPQPTEEVNPRDRAAWDAQHAPACGRGAVDVFAEGAKSIVFLGRMDGNSSHAPHISSLMLYSGSKTSPDCRSSSAYKDLPPFLPEKNKKFEGGIASQKQGQHEATV